MEKYLFIGLGGFLGSISRYMLSTALYRAAGESFPYGTLAVNLIGCFIIGVVMVLFQDRYIVQQNVRLFIVIGVLGGFTTFSSFSYETMAMIRAGSISYAVLNSILNLIGCLAATWLGILAGKNL